MIQAIVQRDLNPNVVPALSPYIIGTSNQPVKMTANHGLHLSFRSVKGVCVCVMVEYVLIMMRLTLKLAVE